MPGHAASGVPSIGVSRPSFQASYCGLIEFQRACAIMIAMFSSPGSSGSSLPRLATVATVVAMLAFPTAQYSTISTPLKPPAPSGLYFVQNLMTRTFEVMDM